MIKTIENGLEYYQFELLRNYPIKHAIFTRIGGVSSAPFDSLNIGGNLGDVDQNIIENKKKMFAILDIPFATQYDVWQVHGVDIAIPERPRRPLEEYTRADGIITDKFEFTLVMRFADCVPILLYDPVKNIAGIVHAGWQGTVKNTVSFAIAKMKNKYGVDEKDIVAGIGPSIGPDHYSIQDDVIKAVKFCFPNHWQKMIKSNQDETTFNLWEANYQNLIESGVRNIEVAGICTACNTNEWYSHRQENGNTGRFAALIKLI